MTHDVEENTRPAMEFDIGGLTDEVIDEMYEEFIDNVFGDNSRLQRKDWVKKVSKSVGWILDSQEIRSKVKSHFDKMKSQPA